MTLSGHAALSSSKAHTLPCGEKLKLYERQALSPPGVVSPRVVRYIFFGAINGALCGSADKWGGGLMEWARILAYITGTVDQELLLRNEYLAAENRILRGQLKRRG